MARAGFKRKRGRAIWDEGAKRGAGRRGLSALIPSRRAALFGVLAALGAGAAFANSAVNILHTRAPQLALAIDPNDPVALVRGAELQRAAGSEAARSDAAVLSVVQRSVARLPINGPAFRLYGLSRANNADIATMEAQMRVSDRMERRDIGAQLWLIESAVEANDVDRALRHYDRALRIEEAARPLLYPVLTQAMDSPLIRTRFGQYMAANPPWLESFLRFAVSKTQAPVSMALLARENGGWPEGGAFSSLDTELLARLVANGDTAAAANHFRTIKSADPAILTSLRMDESSTNWRLAPIAWQPFQIDGIESYILASEQGEGALEIEAELEAGYKGPVARKFLALAPGAYTMSATMRAEDFSSRDLARWELRCADGSSSQPLLREEVGFADSMTMSADFTVPSNCAVQALMVSAETLVTTRYVKLVLASASLEPAAR